VSRDPDSKVVGTVSDFLKRKDQADKDDAEARYKHKRAWSFLRPYPWAGEDPTGWWMSPRYEGVRAYWTGEEFILPYETNARSGLAVKSSDAFRQSFPQDLRMEGLFVRGGGYGTPDTYRFMTESDMSGWSQIKFVAYDAPPAVGTISLSFEDRKELLLRRENKARFPIAGIQWVEEISWEAVRHERCHSRDHLRWYLDDFVSRGAHGVMLRQFGSVYDGTDATTMSIKTHTLRTVPPNSFL
jgi:DNA ligase-1